MQKADAVKSKSATTDAGASVKSTAVSVPVRPAAAAAAVKPATSIGTGTAATSAPAAPVSRAAGRPPAAAAAGTDRPTATVRAGPAARGESAVHRARLFHQKSERCCYSCYCISYRQCEVSQMSVFLLHCRISVMGCIYLTCDWLFSTVFHVFCVVACTALVLPPLAKNSIGAPPPKILYPRQRELAAAVNVNFAK